MNEACASNTPTTREQLEYKVSEQQQPEQQQQNYVKSVLCIRSLVRRNKLNFHKKYIQFTINLYQF